jgi:hypothetical protein
MEQVEYDSSIKGINIMSITLTTPLSFTINGVTEQDSIGASTSCVYDFQGMTVSVTYKIGPSVGGNPASLNQGAAAQANGYVLLVTFNVNTGVWSYTYGGQSGGGTLTGVALTSWQNIFIAERNTLEGQVSVTGGLMPGTQVNWTQL